ncbi:hypothetical protein ACJX0J_034704, partial [Zea mays]
LIFTSFTGGGAQGGGTEVGDANTQYFHLLANGRHRKTRIFKLQDGTNFGRDFHPVRMTKDSMINGPLKFTAS